MVFYSAATTRPTALHYQLLFCFTCLLILSVPHIPDVRWSGATEHGRERSPSDVRGVRQGTPDQRAEG